MVKIQIDLPDNVNTELSVYAIRNKIKDKREAVIQILRASLNNGEDSK